MQSPSRRHARQTRPDLLKQQVAVVVAERVVDLFEPVQIEQQERDLAPGAFGRLKAASVRRLTNSRLAVR